MAALDTETILLPDLITSCPFEVKCNPHYEIASIEADAWLASYGIAHSESKTKVLLVTALMCPHASRTRLRDAFDLSFVFLRLDDIFDTTLATTDTNGVSKVQLWENVLDTLQPTDSFKSLAPLVSAFHDWYRRVLSRCTSSFQRRLEAVFRAIPVGYLIPGLDQEPCLTVPDLETYIKIRRQLSGGHLATTSLEDWLELNISDEFWANETLQNLVECTVDLLAWTNDVYSFNVEQSEGQYNLISVLTHNNPSWSIQQAMDQAGQMVNDRYADFERIRQQLPSWGTEIDAQIEKYVIGLTYMISGHLHWSFETPKYFGMERQEVKRTRCIKLLPPKSTLPMNITSCKQDAKNLSNGKINTGITGRQNGAQDKMNYETAYYDMSSLTEVLKPFNYIKSLPTKNIRSKIINAYNYWFQVSGEKLVVINEIIDMLHNASLMIDDIGNSSQFRQGGPTAHMIYGTPLTINAIEFTNILALQKTITLKDSRAVQSFTDRLIDLHRCQGYAILCRDNHVCPTEEDYCQMVHSKYGDLFHLALDLLRICSPINLKGETIKILDDICRNLSLLYQICGDYCDLVFIEYAPNKSYCENWSEGKYSFPIIHAIHSRPNDHRIRDVLKQHMNNDDLKREVIRLLQESGSIEYTKAKCLQLADECYALIDKLESDLYFKTIVNLLTVVFEDSAQNGTK